MEAVVAGLQQADSGRAEREATLLGQQAFRSIRRMLASFWETVEAPWVQADEFLARKFAVAVVDNTQSGYRGVAAVVSGAAGQSAAFSVQRNLPKSDYFQDGRSDGSVDVILTGEFKELTAPDLVDQTPGQLSCPRESRRIVDSSKWPVIPKAG